jgi:serine/threonine protein kinase
MTPERYQQIGAIYNEAVDLEPREREAFLAKSCGEDAELLREVLSLIEADQKSDNFISSPALEVAAGLLAQDKREEIIGKQIKHFKILSLLGAGGMGEVYLAQDMKLGRKVALKLLPAAFTQNRDLVKRFRREARTVSALNHPNIITIHEIGELDNLQFIATEYIEGETLHERLMREPLSLNEVIDISVQITSALVAAHQEGIIHRDIKPENIMLRPDGYVKVLDFGLAKLTEQKTLLETTRRTSGLDTTEPGLVMGTVAYMSPEQVRGLPVDTRTDIFSLGVVLYEMTTEHSPFKRSTPSDVIAAILKTEPPLVTDYSSNHPIKLANIIRKALNKECNERYQTAKELLDDLKSLKRDMEFATDSENSQQLVSDEKHRLIQTTQIEVNETDETKLASTQTSRMYAINTIKRHKKTALIVSALLLIFLLVFTYFFFPLHND